jgi:hypothetical protein
MTTGIEDQISGFVLHRLKLWIPGSSLALGPGMTDDGALAQAG